MSSYPKGPPMKHLIRLFVLFICLPSTAPLPVHAQEPAAAAAAAVIGLSRQMPIDPLVLVGTLDNGLRYYIRENQEPENRAELRLVVKAGSILEDDDQQGLAHLTEHMAFNGTTHFEKQELVNYLESIGMRFGPELNAGTGFDETTYMLTVPTDSIEAFETAFLILEDWAHGITFDPEEVNKERGVIVEEWRLGRGAGARMRDKQYPILFKDSRYAERLPIGQMEIIENFEPETLVRFYRDWYRPDLMAVVAVGDFDKDHVETLIKTHFSRLAPVDNPRPRLTYDIPDHVETLFAIATDPEASGSSVAVYFKQPLRSRGTVGFYRQQLVERLYNSMFNQRLSELSLQADPPFIFASSSQGIFVRSKEAYTLNTSVKDGGIPQGLETLLTEAERVGRHGFIESELERVKTNVLRSMERSFAEREKTSSRSYVSRYIGNFTNGSQIADIGYRYELYKRFVPEITLGEVNQLARQWISDENRVVMVNAPDKEGLETPTEQELSAVFEAAQSKEIEPYTETVGDEPLVPVLPEPGSIVSERIYEEVGVTEWELSNGVRVAMKPTDFKEDQIMFRAFSPGGLSLVDDEVYLAVSNSMPIIGMSGLSSFNMIDLNKKLAGKVASAMASVGELEEGLSGSASPQDLETMFQLIYLNFTAPRADSTMFLSMQARMRAVIANRGANPMAAFSDTLQVTMTQYHPRAPLVSEAMVDVMDLQMSFELYKDRFADASDFTFVFVGNLDLSIMRPLVERYLGSLPSIDRIETWRDVGPKPPEGVIVKSVYKGMEPQSQSVFIFTGPFEDSRANRHAFQSMNSVLQIKLRERIREELGGTYNVGVNGSNTWRPTPVYSISISYGCDPERVEELKKVVFKEIEKLKSNGPGEEDLNKVKESQRRTRETNLEQNSYWLSQLAFRYQKGQDPTDVLGFEVFIEALTAEMIQESAKLHFNMDNYIQVTLYPETER